AARPLALVSLALATPLAAAPLSPDAGAFAGEGTLADGEISGTLAVEFGGKAMAVTMRPGPALLGNGRCSLRREEGRTRLDLSGECHSERFGPRSMSAYVDGGRCVSGRYAGTLRGGAAAGPAPAAGTLPAARLLCSYRERIGGIAPGDI